MWSRRTFLRSTSLAVIGSIFVPKYERWFRPIVVAQPGQVRWYAALFTSDGEVMKAPLTDFFDVRQAQGYYRSHFPVMTRGAHVQEAAIVDRQGNKLYDMNLTGGPRLLMSNDQPVLTIPKINEWPDA